MSVRKTVSLSKLLAVQATDWRAMSRYSEYLRCLHSKIILADQFAFLVERSLTRDEDDAISANIDNLRITGRRAKFWWI